MKREWTLEKAIEWVERCEVGKEVKGLKYCSAVSYIRSHAREAVVYMAEKK